MKIRESRDGRPEILRPVPSNHPLFLIQPRLEDLNGSKIPILLGRQFSTTMMMLSNPTRSHMRRRNAHHHDRKLSVQTDHSDGARIHSPFEMKHRDELSRSKPWLQDPFGHVNRYKVVPEIVSVGKKGYVLLVRAVVIRPFRDSVAVRVSAFRGNPPLLAVHADTLFGAFPELEKDPNTLLDESLTFEELYGQVREAAERQSSSVLLLEAPVDPPRT